MSKRTAGTTTFGILAIVYGFIALWLTVFGAMGIWILKNDPALADAAIQFSTLDIISSLLAFILAVAFCVSGIGVLMTKEWARKLIVRTAIIAIPNGLYGGLSGALKNPVPTGVTVPMIFILVIALMTIFPFIAGFGLSIWHFTKSTVKEQFRV